MSMLHRPGQWDHHVPSDLKEPFPWAHPNYPNSIHPFSKPIGTFLFGVAVILMGLAAGGVAYGSWLRTGDEGAIWAGAFGVGTFGLVGLWGAFVGARRLKWQRRFTRVMGFSPFSQRPQH